MYHQKSHANEEAILNKTAASAKGTAAKKTVEFGTKVVKDLFDNPATLAKEFALHGKGKPSAASFSRYLKKNILEPNSIDPKGFEVFLRQLKKNNGNMPLDDLIRNYPNGIEGLVKSYKSQLKSAGTAYQFGNGRNIPEQVHSRVADSLHEKLTKLNSVHADAAQKNWQVSKSDITDFLSKNKDITLDKLRTDKDAFKQLQEYVKDLNLHRNDAFSNAVSNFRTLEGRSLPEEEAVKKVKDFFEKAGYRPDSSPAEIASIQRKFMNRQVKLKKRNVGGVGLPFSNAEGKSTAGWTRAKRVRNYRDIDFDHYQTPLESPSMFGSSTKKTKVENIKPGVKEKVKKVKQPKPKKEDPVEKLLREHEANASNWEQQLQQNAATGENSYNAADRNSRGSNSFLPSGSLTEKFKEDPLRYGLYGVGGLWGANNVVAPILNPNENGSDSGVIVNKMGSISDIATKLLKTGHIATGTGNPFPIKFNFSENDSDTPIQKLAKMQGISKIAAALRGIRIKKIPKLKGVLRRGARYMKQTGSVVKSGVEHIPNKLEKSYLSSLLKDKGIPKDKTLEFINKYKGKSLKSTAERNRFKAELRRLTKNNKKTNIKVEPSSTVETSPGTTPQKPTQQKPTQSAPDTKSTVQSNATIEPSNTQTVLTGKKVESNNVTNPKDSPKNSGTVPPEGTTVKQPAPPNQGVSGGKTNEKVFDQKPKTPTNSEQSTVPGNPPNSQGPQKVNTTVNQDTITAKFMKDPVKYGLYGVGGLWAANTVAPMIFKPNN